MAPTYLNLSLVYLFFLLSCSHHAFGLALPDDSPNPASKSDILPSLDLNETISNLQAQPTVGDAISNLLRAMQAEEDLRYRGAALVNIHLKVTKQDGNFQPTLSRNIRDFRCISAFFHVGGLDPAARAPDGIAVENQYPEHWDQWREPVFEREVPGRERGLYRMNWELIWSKMSIGRADYLLKRAGYVGKYGEVTLMQLAGRPIGWCFDFYHPVIRRNRVSAINVEVFSGNVVDLGERLRCTVTITAQLDQQS
ncbi:MAG: hypothetical protein L6R40_007147 [Gallowayella cf. fulva]|nr:MAG: hypothetical protein L6R40_007147 [Xanthomendoza cf. fulva]